MKRSVRIRFEDSRFAICCHATDAETTLDQLTEQVLPYAPAALKEGPVLLVYDDGSHILDDEVGKCRQARRINHDLELTLRKTSEQEKEALRIAVEVIEEEKRLAAELRQKVFAAKETLESYSKKQKV